MKQNRGFTLIELLVVVAVVLIIAAMARAVFSGSLGTSDGSRIGTISKLSYKGAFGWTKSWEGEMYVDSGSAVNSEVWKFSITPGSWSVSFDGKPPKDITIDVPSLVQKLQDYKRGGVKVELFYHEKVTAPWTADTRYRLVDVIPVSRTNRGL